MRSASLVPVSAVLLLSALVACGGSDSGSSADAAQGAGGSGTAGSGVGGSGTAGSLAAGTGGASAGSGTAGTQQGTGESTLPTYAVSKLYQGSGGDDLDWQAVAMNVDDLAFPAVDLNTHCKPFSGGKPDKVVIDGMNGVDNSYSRNVMPLFLTFQKDAPKQANDNIQKGAFTILTRFPVFTDAPDQTGLVAEFFPARGPKDDMGATVDPKGDFSTYFWEPAPEGISGDATGAGDNLAALSKVQNGTLVGNVWTSGDPTVVNLIVSLSGISLPLRIRKARVVATFAEDHKSASKGVLSGVLATDEMVSAVQTVAGKISPALCSGAIIDNILTQVKQASDMMMDGTQDPAKTCNGISVGLGFDSTVSKVGKAAAKEPPDTGCQ